MMREDGTLQFRLPLAKKVAFLAAVAAAPTSADKYRSQYWYRATSPADVLRQLVDDYIEKHKPKPDPAKPTKKKVKP